MPPVFTPGTFEECADEMNDFINTLDRYPPNVLVFVFRAHLVGLLQALLIYDLWTREEVATFMEDMQLESLNPDPHIESAQGFNRKPQAR